MLPDAAEACVVHAAVFVGRTARTSVVECAVVADVPGIRYAASGDVSIAYQIIGHGPIDLVRVPGMLNHIETTWDEPSSARHCRRLASFSRLIIFDKRGTGLSDRLQRGELPTVEQRIDDVRAVMDAAGSERAAVFGTADGGPVACVFAAMHPDRVSELVLYGTSARLLRAEDYPEGISPEKYDGVWPTFAEWGDDTHPHALATLAPSAAGDPRWRASVARMQRTAATPRAAEAFWRIVAALDIRHLLPLVRVPTLVIHCTGDRLSPVRQGRYLASHIAGAKYVEVDSADHLYWIESGDRIADEIEEFITGHRSSVPADRVLATVLFTDIVDSTSLASRLGDRRWRVLLDEHDRLLRREVDRHGGRYVESTGDGALATFDGPSRAIDCALELCEAVRILGLEIRAGLHTGEVEVRAENIGGIAVHVAARVAALAGPAEVLASRTVRDLVAGSPIRFHDHGVHSLKGISEDWRLYAVTSGQ